MNILLGQIVTHIIGFLLAVWLLKKFAWGHLLGFMEKRRETIANSFAEIEKGQAEVQAQKEHYEQELQNIEVMRREKIQEAAHEAEELASKIKEEARQEAVEMRQKAEQDIAIELDKANEILKDRIIDTVFATTEKMIRESLDKEKHSKLVDDFLAKVNMKERHAGF